MKKTNKSREIKNDVKDRKIIINDKYSTYNNKEKIIYNLKQKGFNANQIKDIFETFNSNIKEENIIKKGKEKSKIFNYKKIENNNIRSMRKNNSSLMKKQNSNDSLLNKYNSKNNYLKLNVNNSSLNKVRNYELNTKNKKDLKIINLFNKRDEKTKFNNSYSKKYKEARNIKIENYLKKYNSHSSYVTNINSPKKVKETGKTDNKINKLKIIPINKKIKDKIKLSSYFNNNDSKIDNKRGNKNVCSKNCNLNLVSDKIRLIINQGDKVQKENHLKDKNLLIKKCILKKNIYSNENKLKRIKKNEKKEIENKLEKDQINNHKNNHIHNFSKKLIPISSGRNIESNILKIRKQKSKEEDILAMKNTGITEIKIDNKDNKSSFSRYSFNNYNSLNDNAQVENNTRFNTTNENKLKKFNTNYSNHNFVSINLCKDKTKGDIILKEDKFLTKQNSFPNYKYKISIKNDNNINRNFSIENNNNKTDDNHNYNFNKKIIYRSYNSSKQCLTNKEKINEIEKDNINISNKNTKIYDVGKYEGIILDNKRELKGVMTYNNGARYDGEWKDDKKSGKGVYISSHYFNCEKKIGLKYEGEFFNDKFEGYGIAIYSNGDKYEGEWKNNKQYGKGTLTNIGGTKYIGDWIDGIYEGNGIYYMNNGERYEGHFSKNKYNGYGKYFYNNGDYLEGIFKDDRPTSNCVLHLKGENT